MQKVIVYKDKHLPRLNDKGKNPAKDWVISFYLFNNATGKYERQRKHLGKPKNSKGNYEKRLREAKSQMAEYKREMLKGWHVDEAKSSSNASMNERTLEDAMQIYKDSQSEKMVKAIKAVISALKKNCSQVMPKPLSQVNKQDCLAYRNAIKNSVSAVTCNYYMRVLGCFFNYAIENEWITQNPAKGIKPLRTKDSDSNFPFSPSQRQSILDKALESGEKQLYLLCQFVYFTLARPYEEIQMLKVSNIREKDIFYPAVKAKNGKNYAVPIAPSLEAIIQEYKLRDYPAEYYIFGKNGEPSETVQGDIFYAKHRKILETLRLTKLSDRRYTLYSHKATGAIALAQRAKSYQDLRKIQMMCRHQTLEETEGYLRKMGVNLSLDDTDFLE